jgi:threonine/homoserine efflux transporter RhtA
MNISRKTLVNSFWFALEVIGIFIVIQVIRFVIGNLDAIYSGLSLVLIAAILFIIAFLIARNKDNQNPRKPRAKTFTGLLS